MTNPHITMLSLKLKDILTALADIDQPVKHILASNDLRTAREQIQTEMGSSISVTLANLNERMHAVHDMVDRLAEVLYYLELETIQGKGEWREIATSESNLRLSLNAVRSLRQSHGLGLSEARKVVEAFTAGLFK